MMIVSLSSKSPGKMHQFNALQKLLQDADQIWQIFGDERQNA